MSNVKEFRHEWHWDKVLKTGHLNAKKRPMRHTEDILVFSRGSIRYNPQMVEGNPQHGEGKRKIKVGNTYGGQSVNYKEKLGETLKYPGSLIRIPKDHAAKCIHPTQKPVGLMEYLILTYSNVGDTVLDFTMGSGTTGVACMNEGRNFIGIEKDEKYFEIASSRILEAEQRNDWVGLV